MLDTDMMALQPFLSFSFSEWSDVGRRAKTARLIASDTGALVQAEKSRFTSDVSNTLKILWSNTHVQLKFSSP